MQDALKAFAEAAPTFYTLWATGNRLAYGAFDASGLLYATATSLALLLLAMALVRRP